MGSDFRADGHLASAALGHSPDYRRAFSDRMPLQDGEGLADLIRYSGGFAPSAAPAIIHIRRILPLVHDPKQHVSLGKDAL